MSPTDNLGRLLASYRVKDPYDEIVSAVEISITLDRDYRLLAMKNKWSAMLDRQEVFRPHLEDIRHLKISEITHSTLNFHSEREFRAWVSARKNYLEKQVLAVPKESNFGNPLAKILILDEAEKAVLKSILDELKESPSTENVNQIVRWVLDHTNLDPEQGSSNI